jgi:CubicO group peptidase (beta-lactamase class C family)
MERARSKSGIASPTLLAWNKEPVKMVTLVNRNAKYNSLEEEINDFAKKRNSIAIPGTEFRYGNVGLNIAARVVEVVSGKGFEEIFQERLGKPLNFSATTLLRRMEKLLIPLEVRGPLQPTI